MNISTIMDEETAALILRLELEDTQELSDLIDSNGKGKEGELSDAQLALALYRDDLERSFSFIRDRAITRSIARACQTDGALVTSSLSQEQAAVRDIEAAYRLRGVRPPAPIEAGTSHAVEVLDDEAIERLSTLYIGPLADVPRIDYPRSRSSIVIDDNNGESSTWAATRASSSTSYRQCIACQEDTADHYLASVTCNHEYCQACLEDLFRAALTDESLFPPRCCRQHITPLLDSVRIQLPNDPVKAYEKKKVEFETKDRTYCANPACAVFIPLKEAGSEKVTCLECSAVTCTMCKAADHKGDCPKDAAAQQLLELGRANGWQRCNSCRRMVELDIGCYHIT